MKNKSQQKYAKSEKGRLAQKAAQQKYDESDKERRRKQKREYMRKKRLKDPNYCKWK
jgi:hypothetical protein